jgi:hypothetical protein
MDFMENINKGEISLEEEGLKTLKERWGVSRKKFQNIFYFINRNKLLSKEFPNSGLVDKLFRPRSPIFFSRFRDGDIEVCSSTDMKFIRVKNDNVDANHKEIIEFQYPRKLPIFQTELARLPFKIVPVDLFQKTFFIGITLCDKDTGGIKEDKLIAYSKHVEGFYKMSSNAENPNELEFPFFLEGRDIAQALNALDTLDSVFTYFRPSL